MGRWVAALIASLLMLLVGPAASASAEGSARLVMAVPGAGPQFQLHATEGGITEKVADAGGFGQVSGYARVPAGSVSFELRGQGARVLSRVRAQVRNGGRYTVLALGDGGQRLQVLQDGAARPGASRLRVVNAAPELGDVDVHLAERRVADGLGYGNVAGYATVEPGAYALRVTRPGETSPLVARGAVPVTAGTASTAFVVGTAGEPLDVVVAADRAAAPRGAPATGLGGLAGDDSRLLAALIAGLLAAAVGGGAYVALTGRARRGGS